MLGHPATASYYLWATRVRGLEHKHCDVDKHEERNTARTLRESTLQHCENTATKP